MPISSNQLPRWTLWAPLAAWLVLALSRAVPAEGLVLAVFAAARQLTGPNRHFGEILMLPPLLVQLGIPLTEILEYMAAIGPSANRSARSCSRSP